MMKALGKKWIACLFALASLYTAFPGEMAVVCWVSPDGRDDAAGTQDAPFATLERARDEIRSRRAAGTLPTGGAEVRLMKGRHVRTAPFVLVAADSGTDAVPVVYRGEPGAEVRLSGGVLLTGSKPVSDARIRSRLPAAARASGWPWPRSCQVPSGQPAGI